MRSDKDKRIIRLLRIIIILGQSNFNSKKFAVEERCSWRTVQRDIHDLEVAGFPLQKEYNGTWKLDEDFKNFGYKHLLNRKAF